MQSRERFGNYWTRRVDSSIRLITVLCCAFRIVRVTKWDMAEAARDATSHLIARVEALRALHGWSEAALARKLGWLQTRLNKSVNRHQRFLVSDLDRLAEVFGITVPELFFDEYGQWDRRTNLDRRKGERRQLSQTIYDPQVKSTHGINRLSFAPGQPRD